MLLKVMREEKLSFGIKKYVG